MSADIAREINERAVARDLRKTLDELVALRAEVEALRAAVQRVRDLHYKLTGPGDDYCVCGQSRPCPTIAALDGAQ